MSGGKPTTLQFFESSASLETELLTSEMKDLQSNLGSYDLATLLNLVSIPLFKRKLSSGESTNSFNEKDGWGVCAQQLSSDCVEIEERWGFDETFHNAADKQQLSRHVKQTVEYIDLFSPSTILRTSQHILTALHAKENHHHLLENLIST